MLTRHAAPPIEMFDPASLQRACEHTANPLSLYKKACVDARAWLDRGFHAGMDIVELIHLRAAFIDQLLVCIWQQYDWGEADISLAAVGGYGRGELHPHSDIDLLILTGTGCASCQQDIEGFIALLWDIKLNIGHSVRTVEQCVEQATADIGVTTTLSESRLIAGSFGLLQSMQSVIGPDQLWPSDQFFRAKWDEQKARHSKYADTEYNLEPNVKSSPGGLRDIQMIGWIALRQYGESDPESLAELGFLTADELDILINGRNFLWRVRYALHMLNGREEDRLLFDYQRELAELFDCEDGDRRLAVEQFMQQYYRWVLALGQLNEVLMQHFDQVILRADGPEEVKEINSRFLVRNGYLEARNTDVFDNTPSALLEVFVLCAQNQEIEGVHVATIRQIRDHRDLIDDAFRQDPRNRRLFMELLKSPYKLGRQLRRMNRYGILGQYLPEFGKIVGQMQHDLFHIYTVDAHTLEVIKNMRRFLFPEFQERFPVTSRVASRLPKLELLYISGLYHDIGKGRGGDHSELGAVDAELFCQNHGLSTVDTNLVCWLVKHHLTMSGVAQRKDITDPDVIQDFATMVGDQLHLDYLLALTVADINATNPNLWNAWRGSLLRQLYTETKRALRRGLENQVDKQEWIRQTQQQALEQLEDRGFTVDEVEDLWAEHGEDYFLREQARDIVWHTEAIAQHFDKETPLVLVKPRNDAQFELATQIFIHARAQDYLFSVVAAALEQLELSVHDARVYKSIDGMAMDTFYVLDANGESIAQDPARIRYISTYLRAQLKDRDRYPEIVKRRTPRQIKFFSMPTETTMRIDPVRKMNVLEVTTPDRPGLLARIGRIFFDYGIELQAAKIATLGERVEDVFFITTADHQPIENDALCTEIQAAICKQLDDQASATADESHLELLQAYPFEKLRKLFEDITPNPQRAPISLGMGEPQHPAPGFVIDRLRQELPLLAKYPATKGIPELRQALAAWLQTRYQLNAIDPDSQILPVNGTREAIFALTQTVVNRQRDALVLSPNPFYQIYEGASLLAGASVHFIDCSAESGFLPDFDTVSDATWDRCQLLFLCSPGNPTGAVLPLARLQRLIELAHRHDFVIASDECYAEIYADESRPPIGLLQACRISGVDDFRHCVVFHSLSKRSNLPGMRSGFVAGDAAILDKFLLYRTYHGCAMPLQHQWASISAWSDEGHVRENRRLYHEKFTAALDILGDSLPVSQPAAGFYLWPQTPVPGTDFARGLLRQENVTVLPGRFLARSNRGCNPGEQHVRMALVAPLSQCQEAARRIRRFCAGL